jgi:E3 ubiquitin-protein ligase UBR2
MDLQVRQITHHVEYELEWESAFTLHTKLAAVSALILQWCGTDRIVFIKAVRMLFKKLFEDQKNGDSAVGGVGPQRIAVGPIAGHTAACVEYQVSSKPVSMHQPLTRLLAGLSLHMEKFGLDWNAN